MIISRSRLTIAVLAVATVALTTACSGAPAPEPPLQPRRVVELGRWQAHAGDRLLGHLVQLEIQDPKGPVRFYQVLDAAGRIVGSATASGRFSRRVPFEEDEQDVGVWSLPRGVARLFDTESSVRLTAVASSERSSSERSSSGR
ncbi:MAG: hypothetical protein NXI31_24205 [bacterium]|nr:hypothetical protein [bacterium]